MTIIITIDYLSCYALKERNRMRKIKIKERGREGSNKGEGKGGVK